MVEVEMVEMEMVEMMEPIPLPPSTMTQLCKDLKLLAKEILSQPTVPTIVLVVLQMSCVFGLLRPN